MKNYIIEIGNFKGDNGYKFSTNAEGRQEILTDFVKSVVINGKSKFLKEVFLGEGARMNSDQPVSIVGIN